MTVTFKFSPKDHVVNSKGECFSVNYAFVDLNHKKGYHVATKEGQGRNFFEEDLELLGEFLWRDAKGDIRGLVRRICNESKLPEMEDQVLELLEEKTIELGDEWTDRWEA